VGEESETGAKAVVVALRSELRMSAVVLLKSRHEHILRGEFRRE
jgi:hypothetical protein